MTSIQATVEFLVELGRFHNVDLFQRGYYQIRLAFKNPPKVPCQISRPELYRPKTVLRDCACEDTVQLAYIDNDSRAASKTVQILYKDQTVPFEDAFLFKIHLSLDPNRIETMLRKAGLLLNVQLWFTEEATSVDVLDKLSCVSERQLRVHFLANRGLHHHLPVFFDYFHLCAIGMTLHGALTNISHCYLPNLRAPKSAWASNGDNSKTQYSSWESILFANNKSQVSKGARGCCVVRGCESSRLAGAYQLHRRLCHLLLSAYESLQNTLQELIEHLPGMEQLRVDHIDCHHRLENVSSSLTNLADEEDIAQVVCGNVAELSSENLMLFHQMVDVVALQPAIGEHLSKRNHHQRVKRFAETFFTHETSASHLLSVYENNVTGHENLAALVRGSRYFQSIPPPTIECPELDGDPTTMPIIFEDVYLPEVTDRLETASTSQVQLRESRGSQSSSSPNGSISVVKPRMLHGRTLIPRDVTLPRQRPLASISADLPDSCEGKRGGRVALVGYRKLADPEAARSRQADEEERPQPSVIALGTLSSSPSAGTSTEVRKMLGDGDDNSSGGKGRRKVAQSMPDLVGALSRSSSGSGRRKQSSLPKNWSRSLAALRSSFDFGPAARCQEDVVRESGNSTPKSLSGSNSLNSEGSEECGELTVLEMLQLEEKKRQEKLSSNRLSAGGNDSGGSGSGLSPSSSSLRLVQVFSNETLEFVTLKEELKRKLDPYPGHLYSDFPNLASTKPYFSEPGYDVLDKGLHMVVCVHGLDGNSADLRLVKTYLQLALPDERLVFVMSERNQADTFADFDQMTENLVTEVIHHLSMLGGEAEKISFVAHSMGCLLVRAALDHHALDRYRSRMHTFLSLSGPHLGMLYNSSGLVNMGMWVMQRWKKSGSLLQLALKDCSNIRESFVYKLSERPGLEYFRYVLLVSSLQDRYVPYHSTRIELCKAAVRDNSEIGAVYMEMVTNILQRVLKSARTTVVRYDVFHSLGSNANTLIGRAAHIAVLDSEIFLEKFISVCAAKYFR